MIREGAARVGGCTIDGRAVLAGRWAVTGKKGLRGMQRSFWSSSSQRKRWDRRAMSAYLGSDRSSPCTCAADAYREWGGVAGDDALDIGEMGTHPISLRTKITPADTFSDRPLQQTLAPPPKEENTHS